MSSISFRAMYIFTIYSILTFLMFFYWKVISGLNDQLWIDNSRDLHGIHGILHMPSTMAIPYVFDMHVGGLNVVVYWKVAQTIHQVLVCGNMGQGGKSNAHGKSWVSRLGLGLAQCFVSFIKGLPELFLSSSLWRGALGVNLRWQV